VLRLSILAFVFVAACAFGGCGERAIVGTPFPSAVAVRVYGAPEAEDIEVTGEKVSGESARVSSNGVTAPYATPVRDGGWLTPGEVVELKSAVGGLQPLHKLAHCCDPRHAFLFYDASRRYLGYVTVCFECGCAQAGAPGTDEAEDVSWNESTIAKIAAAHGLPRAS